MLGSHLVVTRRVYLHGLTDETTVADGAGAVLAVAVEEGRGGGAKLASRLFRGLDRYGGRHLVLRDAHGAPLLDLHAPGSPGALRMSVAGVGEIRQENTVGSLRLGLHAGHRVGELRADGARAWRSAITDHTGAEVAGLAKRITGLGRWDGRAVDHTVRYELRCHRPLPPPFAQLTLAAVFAVDAALRHIRPRPGG